MPCFGLVQIIQGPTKIFERGLGGVHKVKFSSEKLCLVRSKIFWTCLKQFGLSKKNWKNPRLIWLTFNKTVNTAPQFYNDQFKMTNNCQYKVFIMYIISFPTNWNLIFECPPFQVK